MDADLQARSLSRARATVLAYLHAGGGMTQRELADALGVSRPDVTGLVRRLEQDALVMRAPHPTDRRATVVTLTAAGASRAQSLAQDHKALAGFLFSRLTADEVRSLTATLEQLASRLGEPGFERMRASALERWSKIVGTR